MARLAESLITKYLNEMTQPNADVYEGNAVCANLDPERSSCITGCPEKGITPDHACPWSGDWSTVLDQSGCPCYKPIEASEA